MHRLFVGWLVVCAVALSAAAPNAEVAQKVKKAYGLHPDVVRATKVLLLREASTAAQKAAEGRILGGGVYSVGALSLAVNEGAEEDVFAALEASDGEVRDERAAAATRLFVALLRQFPGQQQKVLSSEFARDRLIVFAAADGPSSCCGAVTQATAASGALPFGRAVAGCSPPQALGAG